MMTSYQQANNPYEELAGWEQTVSHLSADMLISSPLMKQCSPFSKCVGPWALQLHHIIYSHDLSGMSGDWTLTYRGVPDWPFATLTNTPLLLIDTGQYVQ